MKKMLVLVLLLGLLFFNIDNTYADIWGVDPTGGGTSAAYLPLVKIDPFTGAEITRYGLPGGIQNGDTGIGLAGWSNALFYTNNNKENGKIYQINPVGGSVMGNYTVSGGWGINGLGYFSGAAGSFIYTSGCSTGDVHRYNAVDGAAPGYYWSSVMGPLSMAGDNGGKIFTTNGSMIFQIDPLNNAGPLQSFASPSNTVVGMAYDGNYLYLSDTSNWLYILDNAGNVVDTTQLTYTLYALGSTEGTGGAVPEPTTMLLLGSGLVGLAGYARKKLKK